MIVRLLNWQGMVGAGVSLALLALLTVQKLEAVHWRKQSEKFEQLYQQEQAAFSLTEANARAAADQARAADRANADRVAAQQQAINERTADEFESRLAAARADAASNSSGRVQQQSKAAADSGAGRSAPMPRLPAAPGGAAEASRQDRLPQSDALTATEQAIQLDELIKWVQRQAAVDNNPKPVANRPSD